MKGYKWVTRLMASAAAVCAAGATSTVPAESARLPDDTKLIASAESAAPARVSKAAAIVAMDATGNMRTLRRGRNSWTCMPDDPSTPGPDPMCLDRPAMEWLHALLAKEKPAAKIGFIYMLAGGSDASNTDPYATKPAVPNHWITTGPHVMIVGADQSFNDAYPSGPDPDTSGPYIMWAGTPYQHLMAPVK
jgi:hypothetical protein